MFGAQFEDAGARFHNFHGIDNDVEERNFKFFRIGLDSRQPAVIVPVYGNFFERDAVGSDGEALFEQGLGIDGLELQLA